MAKPVLAYHLVWSCYGFWLPNDPRGSWSEAVRALELRCFGPARKVTTRRSIAYRRHDRERRLAAKPELPRPPVRLTGRQARSAGLAFGDAAARSEVPVHALAVMPDHVHFVLGRSDRPVEQVAAVFKASATRAMRREGPWSDPRTPWARGCWKVFLFESADVRRAIRYVADNPSRSGLKPQRWSCVVPFDV